MTGVAVLQDIIPFLKKSSFFTNYTFFVLFFTIKFAQNRSMKHKNILATLSSYDASIIRGTRGSKADAIVKDKRTQTILNNMLNCQGTCELEDGTTVEASIEEILIAKAIKTEMENPKGLETIERLAKIRGEIGEQKTIDVNVSLVDMDLAKRAIE